MSLSRRVRLKPVSRFFVVAAAMSAIIAGSLATISGVNAVLFSPEGDPNEISMAVWGVLAVITGAGLLAGTWQLLSHPSRTVIFWLMGCIGLLVLFMQAWVVTFPAVSLIALGTFFLITSPRTNSEV